MNSWLLDEVDGLASFPIARPIVKRANLVRTDQQAVHKIIGKIVQPHARALAIDLSAPGMIVVARRTPCKLSRQIVAQCLVDLRQPFFLR